MAQKPKVLIVDDDHEIARGVGIRFRASGFEAELAHDGAAGLSAAFEWRPDLIVLDLRMPVMGGLEVLAHLREKEETATIPVIVLSASTVDTTVDKVLDRGACCFVGKPFDAAHLIRTAWAVLQEKFPQVKFQETGSLKRVAND